MPAQTLALPVCSAEPLSQVSYPASYSFGTVWNVHSLRPVRTSYAWTSPGGSCRVRSSPMVPRPESAIELPMITTSPATRGRLAEKFVLRRTFRMPSVRSTLPASPNASSGWPVRASSEIR